MSERLLRNYCVARNATGQALIVCLVTILFLTALAGSMTTMLMIQSQSAMGQQKGQAAFYLAQAGVETAMAQVLADGREVDGLGDGWSWNDALFKEVPMTTTGFYKVLYVGAADGKSRPGAVDEERKLNVNKVAVGVLQRLNPALTEALVAAIVEERRKQPFTDLVELTRIDGIDADFLNKPREGLSGGLVSVLTVFGDGRVNVNTAPEPVLACLTGVGKDGARKMVAHRGADQDAAPAAFETVDAVRTVLGLSEEEFGRLKPQLTVASKHFTIKAMGCFRNKADHTRVVEQVVRRDGSELTVLRFKEIR